MNDTTNAPTDALSEAVGAHLLDALEEATNKRALREEQLADALRTTMQSCNSALKSLANGEHLNELGVLQSRATDVERLVAQRQDAVAAENRMRSLVRTFEAAGGVLDVKQQQAMFAEDRLIKAQEKAAALKVEGL